MNKFGIANPSNVTVDQYLVEKYFCGICLLRLIILDLVLLGHWARF